MRRGAESPLDGPGSLCVSETSSNEVIIVLPPPQPAGATQTHPSSSGAAAACKHIVAILSGAMTVFTF